jgi:hypothetical protein
MKVHLTSTPGFSKENIDQVTSLLNQAKGELQFISGKPLTVDQMSLNNVRLRNIGSMGLLSFDELFNLCNLYRIIETIPKEDFIVVLTRYSNKESWFSAFSNRNIFVDVTGWAYFTENDSRYGIAYQVIENIFQSLLELDINDLYDNPNIHQTSIGCINDFCQSKEDVMIKLRTGFICYSCQKRALNRNVSPLIIVQIQALMEIIRAGLMNFDLIKEKLEPQPTTVGDKGHVKIGNKDISLEALPKTLFIFYLSNLDGVPVNDLHETKHKERLLHIYQTIRRGGNPKTIDSLCQPYFEEDSTFLKVKSITNKNLISQIGNQLSEFYVINNIQLDKDSIYKINLPPDYLTLNINM